MKRTYSFVTSRGVVVCEGIELPVFAGVLKHPTEEQLRVLLLDPDNARKYTREALRKLPWIALREFPRDWLLGCLSDTSLPEGRRRALEFMLTP